MTKKPSCYGHLHIDTVFVRLIYGGSVSAVVSAVPLGCLCGASAVCLFFLFLRCHFCFCGVSAEAFLGPVVAQNLFLRCLCGGFVSAVNY